MMILPNMLTGLVLKTCRSGRKNEAAVVFFNIKKKNK